MLRRQTEGLRRLIAAADAGALFSPDQLAVGIREELVRNLLQRSLPVETVVVEQFRVRLDKADVTFESGQSLVTLQGRVSPVRSAEVFADLVVLGGLHRFEVDPRSGTLAAHFEVDRVELRQVEAGALERGLVRSLNEGLSGSGLGALGEVVPPVEVPVRFDQAIDFGGFSEGVVVVPPGRLPLHVSVARIVPVAGRLWVLLEVSAGPKARSPSGAGHP